MYLQTVVFKYSRAAGHLPTTPERTTSVLKNTLNMTQMKATSRRNKAAAVTFKYLSQESSFTVPSALLGGDLLFSTYYFSLPHFLPTAETADTKP